MYNTAETNAVPQSNKTIIQSEMKILDEMLAHLDKELETLEIRLQDVCAQVPPAGSTPIGNSIQVQSPIASHLAGMIGRVNALLVRVGSISQRLEL